LNVPFLSQTRPPGFIALKQWTGGACAARADKAPCAAFQRLPNGNWNVVKAVKIENGKASVMLKLFRKTLEHAGYR
jgi:hypothetical protein